MKKILVLLLLTTSIYSDGLTFEKIKKWKQHSDFTDSQILVKVKAAGGVEKTPGVYSKLLSLGFDKNIVTQMLSVKANNTTGKELVTMPGFTFLYEKTYSCGKQTHTVKEYRHDRTKIEFVLIPSGNLEMGSNKYDDEKPVHRVTVDSFLIAKYEMTQAMWKKAMHSAPWRSKAHIKEGDRYPATYINWTEAKSFCENYGWRLPTEAEWEYACRAGTSSNYYWGNSMDGRYAWYRENTYSADEAYAHQVGKKLPNAFGLHDMTGNVWEWCNDWYSHDYYTNSPTSNPQGPSSGSDRVDRGGGWFEVAGLCRSAFRDGYSPSYRNNDIGFRPCVSWQTGN